MATVIHKLDNSSKDQIENLNSTVGGQQPSEEHLHPPAIGTANHNMMYEDEDSSVAVINLGGGAGGGNPTPTASGILPRIGMVHNNRDVFMVETPDTQGQQRRRFQEIIDSEDETNGNGSKLQR